MAGGSARRETMWQLARYVVIGGFVTALYDVVYWGIERLTELSLQFANLAGYLAAVIAGYFLHSQITFRNHGARDVGTRVRFVIGSLVSFGINAFWTWLIAQRLGMHPEAPLIPISFVTPLIVFAINRWWVFR